MRSLLKPLTSLGIVVGTLLLSSCATLGYYSQAIGGQLSLMRNARPVSDVIADPQVPEKVRRKLQIARKARLFATQELMLPENRSYESYVEIGKPAVVWNVIAAPAYSVTPLRWCYPVAGCLNYRGYFSRADAEAFAADLRRDGNDVFVAGASAYSTLGWFDDPILSTMLRRSEDDLVATMFHELAHQRLYVAGDSAFSEAFAVAVSDEGMRRWHKEEPARFERYMEDQKRMRAVAALLLETHDTLAALYAEPISNEAKAQRKQALLGGLHAKYALLKASWDGDDSYDAWVPEGINNAHLALVDTYQGWVPAFKALLVIEQGDLANFYAAASRLGGLSPAERVAKLQALLGDPALRTAKR